MKSYIPLDLAQLATPTPNPGAGRQMLYPKVDGKWYTLDSTGTETLIGGGGGTGGVGSVGEIAMWGTSAVPTNWLPCDGRSVSTTTYPDLFAAIQYTYGGSGLNFNLPNLKGRMPVGQDTGQTEFDVLGETGGVKTLASHTHNFNDHYHGLGGHTHGATGAANTTQAGATGTGTNTPGFHTHSTGAPTANSDWSLSSGGSALNGTFSESAPISNLPPYLVITYIIRYQTTSTPSAGLTVQDENAAVTTGNIMNFLGAGVTAVDAGGGKVNVTIPGVATGQPIVRAATTTNITLSGTQTVDGVTLVVGDRVLVAGQTSAATNGIYVVASGAWTRDTLFDTSAELAAAEVTVSDGTLFGGTRWLTSFKASDTLGTTAMTWRVMGTALVDVQTTTAAGPWIASGGAVTPPNGYAITLLSSGTALVEVSTTAYASSGLGLDIFWDGVFKGTAKLPPAAPVNSHVSLPTVMFTVPNTTAGTHYLAVRGSATYATSSDNNDSMFASVTTVPTNTTVQLFGDAPDTGWIAPTLLNGWTNYGAPWSTAGYRRKNGIVYLRGLVANGSKTNVPIFTLPAGFRIGQDGHMLANTSDTMPATYQVLANGNVMWRGGGNAYFGLDGTAFIADN